MGGFGSASRYSYSHNTVDNCRILDACRWMREGILRQGLCSAGAWQWISAATGEVESSLQYQVEPIGWDHTVQLIYTFEKTGELLNYAIRLETTRPHRGGLRWWFTCPVVVNGEPCGRRVQKLYLPPHEGQYFGCRHSYHLGYDSRNQDANLRTIIKGPGDPQTSWRQPFPS